MAPSEEIVSVHEATPPAAPMASALAAMPDKALVTSPSPSPPPTTPTPPAAAAPLFRKGQSVWYASTPKTSHDALVLEDAAAGAATVRIRFMTNRFVEDVPVARVSDITAGRSRRRAAAAAPPPAPAAPTAEKRPRKRRAAEKPAAEAPKKSRGGGARAAEAPKKSRSGARKPRAAEAAKPPAAAPAEKASKQAAAAPPPPPAGGDDDWLVEGSPWIGTRLMRTVFDFDAHAAANKADVAFEPQSLASREGRAGGARKVAVDQCACVVVGWLPADLSLIHI